MFIHIRIYAYSRRMPQNVQHTDYVNMNASICTVQTVSTSTNMCSKPIMSTCTPDKCCVLTMSTCKFILAYLKGK